MLQDLQAPSPYAIGRHGCARVAMLTHLYQGYTGEPHLSFTVHVTQVKLLCSSHLLRGICWFVLLPSSCSQWPCCHYKVSLRWEDKRWRSTASSTILVILVLNYGWHNVLWSCRSALLLSVWETAEHIWYFQQMQLLCWTLTEQTRFEQIWSYVLGPLLTPFTMQSIFFQKCL